MGPRRPALPLRPPLLLLLLLLVAAGEYSEYSRCGSRGRAGAAGRARPSPGAPLPQGRGSGASGGERGRSVRSGDRGKGMNAFTLRKAVPRNSDCRTRGGTAGLGLAQRESPERLPGLGGPEPAALTARPCLG